MELLSVQDLLRLEAGCLLYQAPKYLEAVAETQLEEVAPRSGVQLLNKALVEALLAALDQRFFWAAGYLSKTDLWLVADQVLDLVLGKVGEVASQ